MRIVFGIDENDNWKAAADLLPRLRFRDGVVDTLHFSEPPMYFFGKMDAEYEAHRIDAGSTKVGQQMVEEASALLRQDGVITGVSKECSGSAAEGLMGYADRMSASLLAVGSSGKSPVGAFFVGSIGRSLVIGAHRSVLIARGDVAQSGPERGVRAVLATDHSDYASACLDTLMQLAPLGISHLTVLTVYPKHMIQGLQPYLPDFALNPTEWIEKGLEERNQEVVQGLSSLGCTFDSQVVGGDVHEAIKNVMASAKADLLILGAQGHGFVERLTLGSVSFREAMAEPHSVLVLRAATGGFVRDRT